VYQYTRLQTLLDATNPWSWDDSAGTRHDEYGQRSVWATSAPYMNDRREYEHGCDALRKAINSRKRKKGANEAVVLDALKDLLNEPIGSRFFVACFSAKNDDLGQWRGYGDWGRGVCLGYNYRSLENDQPWFGGWVIYEPRTQAKVAEMLVHEVVGAVTPSLILDPSLQADIIATAKELLRVILPSAILLMKDPAFREEAEFRLIHTEDAPSPPEVRYRARDARLIPYVEMTFADGNTLEQVSAPLEEVVLGPAANDKLNLTATKNLLASRGLSAVQVTPSPIPFLP
jgi:hypothetical protein